ncbi:MULTISPECIES: CPBP family intramembrane glutamic endopeptidase [Halorussus]|uniref:CPBP family intramembrane glutamic endopeptidase n=1 Tax=Halorussus TaxID=1070314 RepID=UPI000E2119F9|nr:MULTISPECIES: CPBP family intramembrane glutamic endopeptidase [Halorussus]NHN58641.1 CPBP family intramembrane metalloprotease [Halorussus sp. JP-T4]
MSTTSSPSADPGWSPSFRHGVRPAVALLLFFAVWALASNALFARLFGAESSVAAEQLFGIASSAVQFGVTVLVLRYEGVRLRDVGFAVRLLYPALVATAGLVLVLNVLSAGLVVLRGNELSVGFFAHARSAPYDYSLPAAVAGGVHYYLFVGPAEELAFRGYLQNKVTSLVDRGSDRLQIVVGIVTAATAFSLIHVPTILILDDPTLGSVLGLLLLLALSGVAFGAIYALTRNLYLVAFLHGIGDFSPLFVAGGSVAWPNWGLMAVCYGLLVVLYRRWVVTAPRSTLGVTT